MKQNLAERKSLSIKQIILLLILIIVIIQPIIYGVFFTRFDTIKKLKNNDVVVFNENLINKAGVLQTVFSVKWANSRYMDEVTGLAQKIYRNYKDHGSPLEINESLANALINMTSNMNASGSFVLLDQKPLDPGEKESFAIWDNNTKIKSVDNGDLLVGAGSERLIKKMNLALNSYWASGLNFQDQWAYELYSMIINSHQKSPSTDMRTLGVWSAPYRIEESAPKIISFTMPLIDSDSKEYYGILGIDIDLEYAHEILADGNPHEDTSYAFLKLASEEDGSVFFDVAAFYGPHSAEVVENDRVVIGKCDTSTDVCTILSNESDCQTAHQFFQVKNKSDKNLLASAREILLYSTNSPYQDQRWFVVKIIDRENLYKNSTDMIATVLLAMAVALCLGIIGSIIVSLVLSRNIAKLLENIRLLKKDPYKDISPVGVSEIDEIIFSIINLSRDVDYSASRMQQIVSSVNLAMGAVEIDTESDSVYLTGKAAEILNFSDNIRHEKILPIQTYTDEFNSFVARAELFKIDDYSLVLPQEGVETEIYRLSDKNTANSAYVSITTKIFKKRVLKVIIDVTENVNKINKIQYEKDHDILTGIYNRQAFKHKASKIIDKKDLTNGVVVMWDLDNLKYVNDLFGHDLGDQYIKKAAEILKSLPFENTVLTRISGDEFFALIYDFKSKEEVLGELNNIQQKFVNTTFNLSAENEIKIRATCGLAWYPQDSTKLEELMKYADFAMLGGKSTQKGSINEFNLEKYREDYILLSGKEDLNAFIDEKLVRYAFQPIVDARTGAVFAYEALMRPTSEKLKTVYDVMRLARAQSKLYYIEKLTFYSALSTYHELCGGKVTKKVFINSIPNTFMTEADHVLIVENFGSWLDKVVVEIIESEMVDQTSMEVKNTFLREKNCSLALDDFGAGYSTESVLLRIKPQFIKIDMSIIRDIDTDPNRQHLVSNILDFTKNKNVKVIAEGVETMGELETLLSMGVHYVQGYLLGKPSFELQEVDDRLKAKIRGTTIF